MGMNGPYTSSLNHTLPSGPAVIPDGKVCAVGMGYSVITCPKAIPQSPMQQSTVRTNLTRMIEVYTYPTTETRTVAKTPFLKPFAINFDPQRRTT